jgi:hypothetical protein
MPIAYQRNKREGNPTSFLITEDTAVSVSLLTH